MAKTWQLIYIIIVFASTLISAGLTVFAWRRRDKPATTAFIMLMLCVTVWTAASSMRMLVNTPQAARFWWNVIFFGIATTPVAFLAFALEYTGRGKWLTRARLVALSVIPLITQIIVWTSDVPGLFYQRIEFAQGGLSTAPDILVWGPWFWVHTVYSYSLIMVTVILIVLTLLRSSDLYRRQATTLLAGALFPLTANLIVTFELIPGVNANLNAIGFAVTGMIVAWSIFRYRLLDIVPIARDALIDSMSDGMLVLDAENQVVDLNPAMQAILASGLLYAQGSPARSIRARLIGQPAEEVFARWPDLVAHLEDEAGTQSEIVLQGEENHCHYDLRISMLTNRRGQFTGRLIVLRDITDRMQTEEALRQYTAELEASNAELDAFAHTVAHDLKDPLAVMVGYSSLLESQDDLTDQASVQENLQRIIRNGYKMTDIVDELLLLASVRKVDEVEMCPLDTAAVIAEVRKRLTRTIAEHRAEIRTPDEWPVAIGYAPWVEEVWVNYISNACKYGGTPPHVELGAAEQSDGMVRFWVRDDGAGLTREQQDRLFTQFTQLHELRRKGHGLGLSIVQRIVDKLGGQVGVESQVGTGSTFFFTLPHDQSKDQE
jgi:signal transduction histidine kinase